MVEIVKNSIFGDLFDWPKDPIQVKKIPPIETKRVILFGEGDFSYALAYAKKHPDYEIYATEYDDRTTLIAKHKNFAGNFSELSKMANVRLLLNVNATQVHEDDRIQGVFDKAVFNFPHTGKRDGSTITLIDGFFKSMREVLKTNARVSMALMDNTHYDSTYRIWHSSRHNRFKLAKPRKEFDSSGYYKGFGYTHVSTNIDRSPKNAKSLKYSFVMLHKQDGSFDSDDEFLHSSEYTSDEGRLDHLSSVRRSQGKTIVTKTNNATRNRVIIKREFKTPQKALRRVIKLINDWEIREAKKLVKRLVKGYPNNINYKYYLEQTNSLLPMTNPQYGL